MAWPYTPLMTFVDNSTPYVDAAYLNAVQTAINGLAAVREAVENWNYDDGDDPWTAELPDKRWKIARGSTEEVWYGAATADFPFGHVLIRGSVASSYINLRSSVSLFMPHASYTHAADGMVQRSTSSGSTHNFFWGLSNQNISADPPGASRYALFTKDTAGGTKWKCITKDGTTVQSTVTAVDFPTTQTERVWLRVEVVGTTSVKFYINGALVATHSTNIPDAVPLHFYAACVVGTTSSLYFRVGPLRMSSSV